MPATASCGLGNDVPDTLDEARGFGDAAWRRRRAELLGKAHSVAADLDGVRFDVLVTAEGQVSTSPTRAPTGLRWRNLMSCLSAACLLRGRRMI